MNPKQELLVAGIVVVLAALAVPNVKAFAHGAMHLVRSPEKYMRRYDFLRMKSYLKWVFGLTALCCLYNVLVSRSATHIGQFTIIEFFLLAVGLVAVKLQKEGSSRKK